MTDAATQLADWFLYDWGVRLMRDCIECIIPVAITFGMQSVLNGDVVTNKTDYCIQLINSHV